jgi:DNA-binding XRE family transcriptional regulator
MTMTADEIRLALMRLDMTQGALAALVGVDPRTVRA